MTASGRPGQDHSGKQFGRYDLPREQKATIALYDVLGRRVLELAEGVHSPGTHEVEVALDWLPAGLYLYRLETPRFVGSRSLTVVH